MKDKPAQKAAEQAMLVGRMDADKAAAIGKARDIYIGAGPTAVASTLHQLPTDLTDFAGRTEQVDRLLATFRKAGGRMAITGIEGMAGVGKTALALHVAHKLIDRYPDAQLYVNLRGAGSDAKGRTLPGEPMTPYEALTHLTKDFHLGERLPDSVDGLGALFREDLRGRKTILVLDNAAGDAQIEPLLPDAPDCAIIVTSRRSLSVGGLTALNLDTMSPDDAIDLIRRICDRAKPSQAEILARLCGYLPLAIRIGATKLRVSRTIAVDDYLRRLEDEKERLTNLEKDERSVTAALSLSLRDLDSQTTERWTALSIFPSTFFDIAAAAVWECDRSQAQAALALLHDCRLVSFDEKSQRYHLHDLLRLLAMARVDTDLRQSLSRLHAQHYCSVLHFADRLYMKGGNGVSQGLSMFDLELENVTIGQRWATANVALDETATRLCYEFPIGGTYVVSLRLHPRDRIAWLTTAADGARRAQDRDAESAALGGLGLAHAALGETRRAIEFFDQTLANCRETGNRRGEGVALGNLGLMFNRLGEPSRAIEVHEHALVIFRENGDRRSEGDTLGNLGIAYWSLGKTKQAIEYHQQALDISRELGNWRGECQDLGNIGNAYVVIGEFSRAIEYFEQALVISREMGDRHSEGRILGNLGSAYIRSGDKRRAIQLYEQALALYRESGDRMAEANDSWNLGAICMEIGESERAIELMQSCVDYEREIGHPDAEKDAEVVESLRKNL